MRNRHGHLDQSSIEHQIIVEHRESSSIIEIIEHRSSSNGGRFQGGEHNGLSQRRAQLQVEVFTNMSCTFGHFPCEIGTRSFCGINSHMTVIQLVAGSAGL